MRNHLKHIDILHGDLKKDILKFAIPLIAGNLVQISLGIMDSIVIGQFVGSDAIAAVGSNFSLINLLLTLFMGIASGVNVVVGKCYGMKNQGEVEQVISTALVIGLILGLILGGFTFFVAPFALSWMGTPESIFQEACLYLRIYSVGIPFILLYNFCSAIINAGGNTRKTFACLLLAGGSNLGLNIYFVTQWQLGVAGVAVATVVSNALIAVVALQYVFTCCYQQSRANPSWGKAVAVFKMGIPAGLQGVSYCIASVILQSAVNQFDADVVAGNTIVIGIEGVLYGAMYGFSQASSAFISQNYGAKQYARIDEIVKLCLGYATAIGLVLGAFCIVFANPLLGLYVDNQTAIWAGAIRIFVVFPCYFLSGNNDVLGGAMRGLGHPWPPLAISLSGACLLRIVWIFLVFSLVPQLTILYMVYPISWVLTFGVNCWMYKRIRRQIGEQLGTEEVLEGLC